MMDNKVREFVGCSESYGTLNREKVQTYIFGFGDYAPEIKAVNSLFSLHGRFGAGKFEQGVCFLSQLQRRCTFQQDGFQASFDLLYICFHNPVISADQLFSHASR